MVEPIRLACPHRLRCLAGLVLAAVSLLPVHADEAPTPGLVVQTQSGPVRGERAGDGATRRWLGIPFAAAPVGERRWEAPQPPAPWMAELPATTFGEACPQLGGPYGPPAPGRAWGPANAESFNQPVGSEDCLKLNLWRPDDAETGLPVIVFVHGGGAVVGYSADPLYDGAKLATATHALVVTINYRLGFFGWFTHPALEGDDPLSNSGNFGNLDILQALRFVKANASAFGGDPGNITLMGQSAGANKLFGLLGSPLADGLFQKGIALSGLITNGASRQRGQDYANQLIAALLKDDGHAATPEEAAQLISVQGPAWLRDYLKAKSPQQLLRTLSRHRELFRMPNNFHEGRVLSQDLWAAVGDGRGQSIPLIVGMTKDESKLLFSIGYKVDAPSLFTRMVRADPEAPATTRLEDLLKWYLLPSWGGGLYDGIHRVASFFLHRKVTQSLDLLAQHNPQVFASRFDWDHGPAPWGTFFGAAHASDLPFVFGNFSGNLFSEQYAARTRPGREALSATMMQAIAAFIRTGDPNTPALSTRWPAWSSDADHRKRLVWDASDRAAVLDSQ